MRRIRDRNATFFLAWLAVAMSSGCRFEGPDPPKGSLEYRLVHDSWSSFSEFFSPDRGFRVVFLAYNVVGRESGRISETWELSGNVLELTDGADRKSRYRWFEPAQVFAYCGEAFPKPFLFAPDSMSASQVFDAARQEGIGNCDGATVLRIAGGLVEWSDEPDLHVDVVDLSGMALTRQDRAAIRKIGVIETLILSGATVVDVDLAYLARLSSLTNVALDGTSVSDDGLKYLVRLPLRRIDLSSTRVTDRGIVTLGRISSLEVLYVRDTAVTQAGADSLARRLPGVSVSR